MPRIFREAAEKWAKINRKNTASEDLKRAEEKPRPQHFRGEYRTIPKVCGDIRLHNTTAAGFQAAESPKVEYSKVKYREVEKRTKERKHERRTSQMADNFYADWFSRTQPPRLTPEQMWEREPIQLRNLATSETAQTLIERFDVPEVNEAEELFKQVLQEIADLETRNRLDMAAGKISRAYQILGFCAGRFSQDSRARFF